MSTARYDAILGETMEWAGLRPMTPDGRPIIGRDPEVPGEIIRDLATTGETPFDLTPYAVDRF